MRIGQKTAMTQACPYMSECYKCKLCMNIEIQMVVSNMVKFLPAYHMVDNFCGNKISNFSVYNF